MTATANLPAHASTAASPHSPDASSPWVPSAEPDPEAGSETPKPRAAPQRMCTWFARKFVQAPAPSGVRHAPAGSAPAPSSHHSTHASAQSEPDHPAAPPLAPSQAAGARCTGTAVRAPVWMDPPVPRPDDHPRMHRVPVAACAQRRELERPPPEHLHPNSTRTPSRSSTTVECPSHDTAKAPGVSGSGSAGYSSGASGWVASARSPKIARLTAASDSSSGSVFRSRPSRNIGRAEMASARGPSGRSPSAGSSARRPEKAATTAAATTIIGRISLRVGMRACEGSGGAGWTPSNEYH